MQGLQHTQASLSFTVSQSLFKFMSTESVTLSKHLILCHHLLVFCLQSFPASGSCPMSQLFISHGQSIGASASVLPMSIQGWFPLGLTSLISLHFKRFSRVFSGTFPKASILRHAIFFQSNTHPYITTGKTKALTLWTFIGKVMSLLLNMLNRFIAAFLPRSKHLLVLWLQSLSAVILEPKKIKSVTASSFSPSSCHEVMAQDAKTLVFFNAVLKASFLF